MSFTHSLQWAYSTAGSRNAATVEATSEEELNLDVVIPALADAKTVAYQLDVTQCRGVFILADAAMTVYTNADGGAGGQTLALTAGVPIAWITGGPGTCPLTVDITGLFVDCTAGGNLTIRTLIDATV